MDQAALHQIDFFPENIFPVLITKACCMLQFLMRASQGSQRSFFPPPQGMTKAPVISFSEAFDKVQKAKWANPARSRSSSCLARHSSSGHHESTQGPSIGFFFSVFTFSAVIPAGGEGGPKETIANKKHPWARISNSGFLFLIVFSPGCTMSGAGELVTCEQVADGLKKRSTAILAHSFLDTVESQFRVKAAFKLHRLIIWLQNWNVDVGSYHTYVKN